ncbi:MAG: hypothetical protein HQL79_11645, partial [Magnetococcales bacterium]|nr:hypothetical protein [Magnetococcales bacterium]
EIEMRLLHKSGEYRWFYGRGQAEVGLLQLVLKAVTEPLAVTTQDFEVVRQLGWQEGDILDGILHGANNVAADIVFNTYKVGIESC